MMRTSQNLTDHSQPALNPEILSTAAHRLERVAARNRRHMRNDMFLAAALTFGLSVVALMLLALVTMASARFTTRKPSHRPTSRALDLQPSRL